MCLLLNSVIPCTQKGWGIEPDQRHDNLIMKELDLEDATEVITPGETYTKEKEVD